MACSACHAFDERHSVCADELCVRLAAFLADDKDVSVLANLLIHAGGTDFPSKHKRLILEVSWSGELSQEEFSQMLRLAVECLRNLVDVVDNSLLPLDMPSHMWDFKPLSLLHSVWKVLDDPVKELFVIVCHFLFNGSTGVFLNLVKLEHKPEPVVVVVPHREVRAP